MADSDQVPSPIAPDTTDVGVSDDEPPWASPSTSGTPSLGATWALPLVALIIGMFMSVLDSSIVNVAVPTVQKEFGTTPQDIQWIATAYTLCMGVVVPASAWLGDWIGFKLLYLISLLAFSAASALCGAAWNLNSMIVFRIVQGAPGGIIPVVCMTLVYRIVPRAKIGAAMGMYGLGVVVAPAVGPSLGGYLIEQVNWRLIFYINVPIGLLGALFALIVVPGFPKVPGKSFDLPGFLCIAAGLFMLLLALSKGQDWGWSGYRVLTLLVGGLILLALFVVIELEVDHPLLDVRLFTYWQFVNSLLLISVIVIGLFTVVFFLPVFLQEGQGLQPLNTGLLVLPQALVMVVMMPVAGWLYDIIGPRWPAVLGLTVSGIGTYLLSGINADVPWSDIMTWTMIRSIGVGLSLAPIMAGGIAALSVQLIGFGSAFNNLAQRVSSSFGLAVFIAIATALQAQDLIDRSSLIDPHIPQFQALQKQGIMGLYLLDQRLRLEAMAQSYSDAFLIVTWMTFAAVIPAFFLHSRKAPGA